LCVLDNVIGSTLRFHNEGKPLKFPTETGTGLFFLQKHSFSWKIFKDFFLAIKVTHPISSLPAKNLGV
jgi:hypothetical protein